MCVIFGSIVMCERVRASWHRNGVLLCSKVKPKYVYFICVCVCWQLVDMQIYG